MNLEDAIDLLDIYARSTDDFDPYLMLFDQEGEEFLIGILNTGIIDSHLNIPAQSGKQKLLDAFSHGMCIGALMMKERDEAG